MKKSVLFLAVAACLATSSCTNCPTHKQEEESHLRNGDSMCFHCRKEMQKRVSDRLSYPDSVEKKDDFVDKK